MTVAQAPGRQCEAASGRGEQSERPSRSGDPVTRCAVVETDGP